MHAMPATHCVWRTILASDVQIFVKISIDATDINIEQIWFARANKV